MGWVSWLGTDGAERCWGWSDGVLSESGGNGAGWATVGGGVIRYLMMRMKTQVSWLGSSVDRCFFTRGPWWTVNQGSVDRVNLRVDHGGP